MNSRLGRGALAWVAGPIIMLAIAARAGSELGDDGAFFLRYAENMANGQFWVWNAGEPPMWGASAPLYPPIVSLPIALGVQPAAAIVGVGVTLMTIALLLTVMLLARRFGWVPAVAATAFFALESNVLHQGAAGLETPLTLLLLAAGLWALRDESPPWAVGLIAGLLAVQKLDLLPAGVLLLAAGWLQKESARRQAVTIATLTAGSWYVFAWLYFGSPVPNSFLTKVVHQANLDQTLDWRWFPGMVLLESSHPWLVLLAAFGGLRVEARDRGVLLFLGGTLAVHLITYTARHPFEAYLWYLAPSAFALVVLGAVGVARLGELVRGLGGAPRGLPAVAGLAVVAVIGVMCGKAEIARTRLLKSYTDLQERDRADAGRWVHEHAPATATVFTSWGNPAYYSRRRVLDGSFLNRRYEPGDLVQTYKPELLILQGAAGAVPVNPEFGRAGYQVVKVFDRSHAAGIDYFFAVLARDDVVSALADRDVLVDLMRFVRQVRLGDEWGLVRRQGRHLFVHPGTTTPTRFEFDAAGFARETGERKLRFDAAMAANVPIDAVNRGAARVKVLILRNGALYAEAIVTVGQPFTTALEADDLWRYEVVVDCDGSPDTDWLLVTIR